VNGTQHVPSTASSSASTARAAPSRRLSGLPTRPTSSAATHPGLDVHRVAPIADARECLVGLAGDGRLLVLGSRGMGPVRSFLLGSVSLAVAKHAHGAVVVVRSLDEPRDHPGAFNEFVYGSVAPCVVEAGACSIAVVGLPVHDS
jgi:nucleotide-binding universal stress UspA family protein